MDKQQQEIAYRIAKSVRDEGIRPSDGARRMNSELALKLSSASYLIYVYRHMSEGRQYKRALNASDAEFFLESIGRDDGQAGLERALSAFRLHIEYREGMGVTQTANRCVLLRQEVRLQLLKEKNGQESAEVESLYQQFEEQVRQSLTDTPEKRRQMMQTYPKRPQRIEKMVSLFQRNPHVVAERLFFAKGLCGMCGKNAPFNRRSDDSPYLEVHHITPLSDGGDDTFENTIALCPNCHRHKHFGPSSQASD